MYVYIHFYIYVCLHTIQTASAQDVFTNDMMPFISISLIPSHLSTHVLFPCACFRAR